MASPGWKIGVCLHLMAAFDQHIHAKCRNMGQGVDRYVLKE